jgi:hypothetical protein
MDNLDGTAVAAGKRAIFSALRIVAKHRFPLTKISYRDGRLPQWVIQSPVELWRVLNGTRLGILTRLARLGCFPPQGICAKDISNEAYGGGSKPCTPVSRPSVRGYGCLP